MYVYTIHTYLYNCYNVRYKFLRIVMLFRHLNINVLFIQMVWDWIICELCQWISNYKCENLYGYKLLNKFWWNFAMLYSLYIRIARVGTGKRYGALNAYGKGKKRVRSCWRVAGIEYIIHINQRWFNLFIKL